MSRRMAQPGLGAGGRMVEVQDRTKESFQQLASAELPALYWLARRLVRDGAEDLVQEALLRAYRSCGTLRQDKAAGPWLKTILVNVFRDQLRRQDRAVEELPVDQVEDFSLYQTLIEQDPLPYSDTLAHDYLQAFGNEDVREVLLCLPELYRARWCCGPWTAWPPRRSPACWRCPWHGPGPAASGAQAVRTRAVGVRPGDRTPLRGQGNDRTPGRDLVLGGGAATVGLP